MRSFHRDLIRLAVFTGIVMLHCSASSAQQVINVEEANITGTLLRIGPLGATIGTPLGPYEIDLVNREFKDLGPARVEVKGEKPRDFLKPGMMVRIEGVVENRRTIREPLTEVTVVDPTAVVELRAAGDAAAAGGPAGDGKETEKDLIVGRVRTFRRGVLSLEVPGERKPLIMQAKLTNDAVVKIAVSNIAAAMPGDKVHVKGWKEVGGRLKRVWALEVTITPEDKPAVARAPRVEAKPVGARRAFGDATAEKKPSSKEGKYKGVILDIN